jgi:hypothetical protein
LIPTDRRPIALWLKLVDRPIDEHLYAVLAEEHRPCGVRKLGLALRGVSIRSVELLAARCAVAADQAVGCVYSVV